MPNNEPKIIIVKEPYASKLREALLKADQEAKEYKARYEYLKAKGYFKNVRIEALEAMPFEIAPVTKRGNFMTRTMDFLPRMTLHVR
jgi:hypothetical protein